MSSSRPLSKIIPSRSTCSCRQSGAFQVQRRTYAADAGKGKSRPTETSDSRTDTIRKILYGQDPLATKTTDKARLDALSKVVLSLEAHETIVRAWQLHRRKERESHLAELQEKYDSMRKAMAEFEKADEKLFRSVVRGTKFTNVLQKHGAEGTAASREGRLEGLFPRQLRIPTSTPGAKVWDHDWKRAS